MTGDAATATRPASARVAFHHVVSDTLVMTRRSLLRYVRVPTLLVFSTVQPVMFVLLFAFVFGGAIETGPVDYIDYLIPGIIVQVVVFGSTQTGVALAEDLSQGMVDRFRSLPMARSAVLAGRTLSDSVRNTFVVLLMSVVGLIIGFRIHNGLGAYLTAVLVVVAFGLAFSWISANIGLAIRDVESTQAASFVWVFPLVFASSIFVPVQTMPGWLQAIAEVNPITVTTDASRALILGGPLTANVLGSLAWSGAILAAFVPLAVWQYRRRT